MNGRRISVFPLAGALLFPGGQLPLHVFEPRYRALVRDALARDRMIGMIQPRDDAPRPALYPVGCLGRIETVEALPDGRFDLVLKGVARFRLLRELEVTTPFRQIEAVLDEPDAATGGGDDGLPPTCRAEVEQAARHLAERLGYIIDWSAVARLDDRALLDGIAQVAPFDVAAKQALLEADGLAERAERTIRLLRFFGHVGDSGPARLQ